MCTPVWLEGRSTVPVDRQRASALWKALVDRQRGLLSVPGCGRPGRSTEAPTVKFLTVGDRPVESVFSLFQATVDRAGRPRLQRSDFWPLAVDRAGRPTAARAADWAVTASFWEPYKLGLSWAVLDKIFGEFLSQFFLLYWEVFSTYLRANISNQKGSLSRVFSKVILEFSSTISMLVFSHHTWDIHCYTYPIGIFVVRGF